MFDASIYTLRPLTSVRLPNPRYCTCTLHTFKLAPKHILIFKPSYMHIHYARSTQYDLFVLLQSVVSLLVGKTFPRARIGNSQTYCSPYVATLEKVIRSANILAKLYICILRVPNQKLKEFSHFLTHIRPSIAAQPSNDACCAAIDFWCFHPVLCESCWRPFVGGAILMLQFHPHPSFPNFPSVPAI